MSVLAAGGGNSSCDCDCRTLTYHPVRNEALHLSKCSIIILRCRPGVRESGVRGFLFLPGNLCSNRVADVLESIHRGRTRFVDLNEAGFDGERRQQSRLLTKWNPPSYLVRFRGGLQGSSPRKSTNLIWRKSMQGWCSPYSVH